MGLFDKFFGRWRGKKEFDGYFRMLDGYTPVFSSYDGGVYEMELTRACIHTFATHCSKLKPNVTGSAGRRLQPILEHCPNAFMNCSQFLYKTATIYDAKNTVFILPLLDQQDLLIGYYPADPSMVEIVQANGEPYLRYTFRSGERVAIELYRCGIVSKYLYRSDIFGESNSALNPTLQLLSMQNQGIAEGIKNSASFRFMATVNNFSKLSDLERERRKYSESLFSAGNGGLALFPNTFGNVKQIESTAKIVDPDQLKIIQERVFTYFGTNQKVVQNSAVGDEWDAYYEGKIEPFALQLSQALTTMSFRTAQLSRDNAIELSANRLQYMTSQAKLQVSSQMFDRGILSTNDVMDIWQLPHVPDGDKRYIRKEYTEISQLDQVAQLQKELDSAKASLAQIKASAEPEEGEQNAYTDEQGEI